MKMLIKTDDGRYLVRTRHNEFFKSKFDTVKKVHRPDKVYNLNAFWKTIGNTTGRFKGYSQMI